MLKSSVKHKCRPLSKCRWTTTNQEHSMFQNRRILRELNNVALA